MDFLKKSSEINILVIGDVMLDRYWWGNVNRISPEAPVPVVNLEKISATAGGAANVAANVKGLGANVSLIGIIGNDFEADLFIDTIEAKNLSGNYLIKSDKRQTTVKTRIVAHNQQIARIDQESKFVLNSVDENKVLEVIEECWRQNDLIIISDYNKGFLTDKILKRLITPEGRDKKIVFVDPKGKDYKKYCGATMLTPNRFEFADFYSLDNPNQTVLENFGDKLIAELEMESLLITQGEQGMTLFEKNKKPVHLPVEARKVYDVTGAGDTVIASLAVAVGGGATFSEAAKFANKAAGLVVEQIGTTAITLEML